jgi:GMP synthase-like glutamine amidotransferase
MRVHVFQHVPFEDLGTIRDWLNRRGADIRYTRFFANEPLPALDDIDMLLAMGGPMSVNHEADLPWLRAEKQALREAIDMEVPVLGVCLGAQLIASALGARVYPNPVKEIGWFPVQGIHGTESASTFSFPSESTVFHWHGETFDLPPGAMHLARSAACEHQAIQFKRHVLGLQFHLEMTVDGVRALIENCRNELTGGGYVQRERDLLAVPESQYVATSELLGEILEYLIGQRTNPGLQPAAADARAGRRD